MFALSNRATLLLDFKECTIGVGAGRGPMSFDASFTVDFGRSAKRKCIDCWKLPYQAYLRPLRTTIKV